MKAQQLPAQKKPWPADKVERRSLDSLIPQARKRGTKEVCCGDCGTAFVTRKDSSPKICKMCVRARGGKAIKGRIRVPYIKCANCEAQIRASLGYTYCSVGCRKEHKRAERHCKMCGADFAVYKSALKAGTNASGNFCSRPCYERFMCRTGRTTGRGSQWNRARKDALQRAPFCALCGTRHGLEVHHAIPFRLTADNSQDNLFSLCKRHHKIVESIFHGTEEFGIDEVTARVWQGMLRQWQYATAFKLNEIARNADV